MHKAMPPLSALRAFEAAARHLSLTIAARELNVTAGALSLLFRGLVDFLGVKLFERRVRAIALTAAGKQLYPGLQTGFTQIRDAVATLANTADARVLVVSTSPGLTLEVAGAAALSICSSLSRRRRAHLLVAEQRQLHDRRCRPRRPQYDRRSFPGSNAGGGDARQYIVHPGMQPAPDQEAWTAQDTTRSQTSAADSRRDIVGALREPGMERLLQGGECRRCRSAARPALQ